MRNMSSDVFCHADQENLWMQLLARVSLIDDMTSACFNGTATVTVDVVPLGQFRTPPADDGSKYTASWTKDGVLLSQFDDKFEIEVNVPEDAGEYEVTVQFHTPEVRSDPMELLTAIDRVTVSPVC